MATTQNTAAKNSTAAPELKPIDVKPNDISIDWGFRFDEKEVPDYELRRLLNSTHRKLHALNSISILLQNHHTELIGGQSDAKPLATGVAGGLFDALIELSWDGVLESENLGMRAMEVCGAGAAKEGGAK